MTDPLRAHELYIKEVERIKKKHSEREDVLKGDIKHLNERLGRLEEALSKSREVSRQVKCQVKSLTKKGGK